MSQTHLATPVAVASSCERAVLAGVALSSFAALLLELALTRLFSVVLFYHFSILFARESGHIPRLYSADLAGAALACVGIVPLLNGVGGPNTILFAAAVAGLAAAVWAATALTRKALSLIVAALLLLIAANRSGRLTDIVYAKVVLRDPSWVEFARWNAISRVEVVRRDDAKVMVIDADASTYIMNANPKQ